MLAVQHFRDIRKQIQESLEQIDSAGFAPRGSAYIDGISKTFEARNYLSLLTALGTVLSLYLFLSEDIWLNLANALVVGSVLIWVMVRFTKGKCIGDICTIHFGQIEVRHDLYVGDIWITTMLGLPNDKRFFGMRGWRWWQLQKRKSTGLPWKTTDSEQLFYTMRFAPLAPKSCCLQGAAYPMAEL